MLNASCRMLVASAVVLLASAVAAQPTPPPDTAPPDAAPPDAAPPDAAQPTPPPDAAPPDTASQPDGPAPMPIAAPPAAPAPTQPGCDMTSCQQFGLCPSAVGCATTVDSCRRSMRCSALGFCTPQPGRPDGACVIGANDDCRHSDACRVHGLCAARGQRCVAEEVTHCLQARVCGDFGACAPQDGVCVRDESVDATGVKPRSVGMRTTGIALTIIGPVLGLVGASMLFNRDTEVAAAILAPIGGSMLLAGVPLWALGAQDIPADSEPRSVGALATGVVLAGTGVGGMLVGGFIFMLDDDNLVPAFPMVLGGGLLIGGIAAGIYGIETTRIVDNASLRIGPGSADFTMQF